MPFSGDGAGTCPRSPPKGRAPIGRRRTLVESGVRSTPTTSRRSAFRLTHGRAFTTADRQGTLGVAILSQDVATRVWPGRTRRQADQVGRTGLATKRWLTVVGVAASTRYRELARPRPTLYLPAAQFQVTAQMFVLRTTRRSSWCRGIARDQIRRSRSERPGGAGLSLSRVLDRPLARPRFNALLLGAFSTAALLLSAIGLTR